MLLFVLADIETETQIDSISICISRRPGQVFWLPIQVLHSWLTASYVEREAPGNTQSYNYSGKDTTNYKNSSKQRLQGSTHIISNRVLIGIYNLNAISHILYSQLSKVLAYDNTHQTWLDCGLQKARAASLLVLHPWHLAQGLKNNGLVSECGCPV